MNSLTEESLNDLSSRISNSSDAKKLEIIQNIEKLHLRLMIDYNGEKKRAERLGLLQSGNEN